MSLTSLNSSKVVAKAAHTHQLQLPATRRLAEFCAQAILLRLYRICDPRALKGTLGGPNSRIYPPMTQIHGYADANPFFSSITRSNTVSVALDLLYLMSLAQAHPF